MFMGPNACCELHKHPMLRHSTPLQSSNSTGSGDNSVPHCHKDLEDPAALCAKSASLGHRDAITEIGYCFLSFINKPFLPDWFDSLFTEEDEMDEDCNSTLDMRCGNQAYPANLFLAEWWQLPNIKSKRESDGLEICSQLCGRTETCRNEFYKCSRNKKFYCSHACQDVHWENAHHATCDSKIA